MKNYYLKWHYNQYRALIHVEYEGRQIYHTPADGIPETIYQGCNEPAVCHFAKLIGRELPADEKFSIESDHHRLSGRYEFTAEDTSPVVYFDREKSPVTQYEGRLAL